MINYKFPQSNSNKTNSNFTQRGRGRNRGQSQSSHSHQFQHNANNNTMAKSNSDQNHDQSNFVRKRGSRGQGRAAYPTKNVINIAQLLELDQINNEEEQANNDFIVVEMDENSVSVSE